jgi:hypothetical protein
MTKIQYLAHLMSKNYETTFIKSYSLTLRAFQQHMILGFPNFPQKNYFWIFKWQNCSIFLTINLNTAKPPKRNPPHWGLFNCTKNTVQSTMVWEVSEWQTKKQNKQTPFNLDRFYGWLVGHITCNFGHIIGQCCTTRTQQNRTSCDTWTNRTCVGHEVTCNASDQNSMCRSPRRWVLDPSVMWVLWEAHTWIMQCNGAV